MIPLFAQLAKLARCSFWTMERVMIIDPGETATLILIAERVLSRVQVREHITIPNHLAPAKDIVPETVQHLRSQYDPIRIYLILPQSETVSQPISLQSQSIEEFIAGEAARFQKIEDVELVFDHQPLAESLISGERGQRENGGSLWWLTYCREPSVQQRLQTLGLDFDDVDDVTSTAQGLWSAFESLKHSDGAIWAVDVGRRHTALLQICDGQPQFAASFSSPLVGFPSEQPDSPAAPSPSADALESWLERLLPSSVSRAARQTLPLTRRDRLLLLGEKGLVEPAAAFLRKKTEATVILPEEEHQPKSSGEAKAKNRKSTNPRRAPSEFAAALGVARAALGFAKLRISLLPQACRQRRDRKFFWNRLRGWTVAAAAATIFLLLLATWQNAVLFRMNDKHIQRAEFVIAEMQETEKTLSQSAAQYEQVRPILRLQQETAELIETFAALQSVAQDPAYWLVLLADFDSYYSQSSTPIASNKIESPPALASANPFAGKPGFVAEFSFLNSGETMRAKLLSLVNRLNENKIYRHVDTLAEDIRRPLAQTNVLFPGERHAALSLELRRNYFDRKLHLNPDSPMAPSSRKTAEAEKFKEKRRVTDHRQESGIHPKTSPLPGDMHRQSDSLKETP